MKRKFILYLLVFVVAVSGAAFTKAKRNYGQIVYYIPYGMPLNCQPYTLDFPLCTLDPLGVLCQYPVPGEPGSTYLYNDQFCFMPLYRWD